MGKVGSVARIGWLAAMLAGASLGGVLGERRHSRLTRRVVSGKYGPDRADQPTDRDLAKEVEGQRGRDGGGAGATRVDTSIANQDPSRHPVLLGARRPCCMTATALAAAPARIANFRVAGARVAGDRASCRCGQSQPAFRAMRMASMRLRPPTLLIALDR
jgi:hypothetical protein